MIRILVLVGILYGLQYAAGKLGDCSSEFNTSWETTRSLHRCPHNVNCKWQLTTNLKGLSLLLYNLTTEVKVKTSMSRSIRIPFHCGIFGTDLQAVDLPMIMRHLGVLGQNRPVNCLSWYIEPDLPKYILYKTNDYLEQEYPCSYAFLNLTMPGIDRNKSHPTVTTFPRKPVTPKEKTQSDPERTSESMTTNRSETRYSDLTITIIIAGICGISFACNILLGVLLCRKSSTKMKVDGGSAYAGSTEPTRYTTVEPEHDASYDQSPYEILPCQQDPSYTMYDVSQSSRSRPVAEQGAPYTSVTVN